jgi:hypothetical protein
VQRHGVDHEVVRLGRQIERVVVGHDARLREARPPERGVPGHHGDLGKPPVNLLQSFLDLVGRERVQEQRVTAFRPAAAQGEGWRSVRRGGADMGPR